VPAPLPGNKKFAIKNLLRVNRQQEKTRGNFLDKNKKAAGFMLRPLIYREYSISISFSQNPQTNKHGDCPKQGSHSANSFSGMM